MTEQSEMGCATRSQRRAWPWPQILKAPDGVTVRSIAPGLSMKSLLLGGVFLFSTTLHARVKSDVPTYDVVGAKFEPIMVGVPKAVPDLKRKKEATALTEHLRRGVRLVRLFELVPPKSYLSDGRDTPASPRYANWSSVQASALITATVVAKEEATTFEMRYFDVLSQKEVLGRAYTYADAREAAHRFLDTLIEHLTGQVGPFSSQIAFVRRTPEGKAVYVAGIDGKGMKRVSSTETLSLLPEWENDGKTLLFTSYLKGNPDLYRFHLETGAMDWLSHRRGLNTGASVAPNNKRIALTLTVDGNTEIYLIGPKGGNLTRLTQSWGQDVSATWSPDGQRLAFVSSRSGQPHIYVMNADGTAQRRLTFKGDYNQEPDWSPLPGGKIVFTARDERLNYDIFTVDPNSGEIERLTQGQGSRNEGPTYSPDGQQILFVSNRSGKRALYMMDADGNHQRRLSKDNAVYEDPAWGPIVGWAE